MHTLPLVTRENSPVRLPASLTLYYMFSRIICVKPATT